METVNIVPDANGYEAMAHWLAASMIEDASIERRAPASRVLSGLIELVVYLAALPDGRDRIARIVSRLEGGR